MKRLLLITTLDVEGRRNNREHHVLRQMKPRFDTVTVVYRRRGRPGGGLRALVSSEQSRTERDGVIYIAVDPALNPPEGTARSVGISRSGALTKLLRAAVDLAGIARDLLTVRALTRAARTELAIAGHDNTTVCEAFGPWAARAAETLRAEGMLGPYVYVDRDYEPGFMSTKPRRDWAERMERRAAAKADLTLSIGCRLAARFRAVAEAKTALSPTGVDLSVFTPRVRQQPEATLVFIGRVASWSGVEEVLGAMALLDKDWPCELIVMGPCEPADKARLEQRVADLNLSDRLAWYEDSPREMVAQMLDRAGIGLAAFQPHPLRIHAAPLKLLEYMASGLPVIASAGSEAGDMVTRTGAGVVCATEPRALADAIESILQDPARYQTMSRAALGAVEHLDWTDVMAREYAMLEKLYAPGSSVGSVA